MRSIVLLLSFLLVGCAHDPVVQTEYVVRTASSEQKKLPPYPASIDVKTADQTALAQWIIDTEGRMYELESIIKRLIEFYEKPVQPTEKK